jgi:hypothetical protein
VPALIGPRFVGRVPLHASHIPERFALFTIIVLGESAVAVALGLADSDWELSSAAGAALGFLAVACLWWTYFIERSDPQRRSQGRACKASLGDVAWQVQVARSSHEQSPASTDLLISDDCDFHSEGAPEGDAPPPRVASIWSRSSKLPERSGSGSLRRTRLREPDLSG